LENELKGPIVDFSFQFNLAREKVEKKIFSYLCELSKKLYSEKRSIGILVVLGKFDSTDDGIVKGMRQLGTTQIQKYTNIAFGQFDAEVVKIFEEGADGAIVINQNGQIIGSKIYLMVDQPSVDIPEGTGTRHISAASFSTRDDVIATYTLSEETLVVRLWKEGHFTEQFDPSEKE